LTLFCRSHIRDSLYYRNEEYLASNKGANSYDIMKVAFNLAVTLIGVMAFLTVRLFGNPSGADVISGQANIAINGSTLTINNSNKAIINWQDFSIQLGETTSFVQPDITSSILNRVIGGNLSEIYGALTSNGQVYLINPQGILVGSTGVINTAGFIASTLDVTNEAFLAGGNLNFTGDSTAAVTNLGEITAGGGDVFLIARQIENAGSISAPDGTVGLYAGQEVLLAAGGDSSLTVKLMNVEVEEGDLTAIENSGIIEAARIDLEAAAGNIYSLAVNNTGILEARGTEVVDGIVYLTGGGNKIQNTGIINDEEKWEPAIIRAQNYDGSGGEIYIGETQQYAEDSSTPIIDGYFSNIGVIDASGGYNLLYDDNRAVVEGSDVDGGIVWIGSQFTALGGDILADGSLDGGELTVRADTISLAENISVTGNAGDGGQVEIYAYKNILEISSSSIDASGVDGGSVYVDGGKSLSSSGTYSAVGTDGDGGQIAVTADDMRLLSSKYYASGSQNGGIIRAGGDIPDGGEEFTPEHLMNVDLPQLDKAGKFASTSGVVMRADGLDNGGAIAVWGTDDVIAMGTYRTLSEETAGKGGLIDFSSEGSVRWTNSVTDIYAGYDGYFREDPKNIVIEDSAVGSAQYGIILGAGYASAVTHELEADDRFGSSVSLDGMNLAIGAIHDDGFGNAISNSGAVYLFSVTDTDFNGGQLDGIIGSGYTGGKNIDVTGLEVDDRFGKSVSLDNSSLIVGAYNDDGFGNAAANSGAVYLFSFTDTSFNGGQLEGIIGSGYTGGKNVDVTGLESTDQFGLSVSLDGTNLAVGSAFDSGFGNAVNGSGAVYLFNFTGSTFSGGTVEAVVGSGYTAGKDVNVTALEINDQFGLGVSLDGTNLAVSTNNDDGFGNASVSSGAVYLFTFTDTSFNGGQLEGIIGSGYTGGKNIDLSALESGDEFGNSISLSGLNLAVGARYDDGFGNAAMDSGAVYLFSFSDNTFNGGTLEATIGKNYTGGKNLNVLDLKNDDYFGQSVSLDGMYLAVGSLGDDGMSNSLNFSGAVYIFSFADNSFNDGHLESIIGSGYIGENNIDLGISYYIEDNDRFGRSVDISGNNLVVGSQKDDGFNNAVTDAGAVYLFSFSDSNFSGGYLQGIIGKGYIGGKNIDVSNLETNDSFGVYISLDGTRLAVSAKEDDGSSNVAADSGAVYLFSFTDNSFNGGVQEAIIGKGYTGGKNIDVTSLEASDWFGRSISLDGNNLAVGVESDDGFSNAAADTGAVYLFSFSDSSFNGGMQEAVIGSGYTGGKNINVAGLELNDKFGSGVSLDGTKLAIGAEFEDGNANSSGGSGAVYLYSFTDTSFNGATLEAMIGSGYTGGKNFDLTNLDGGDRFGNSLNLDGNRLAVGAPFADGFGNTLDLKGDVYLFSFADSVFNSIQLESTVGSDYTGGKNINVSDLGADYFGSGVSLDGNRLAIGAMYDDGFNNSKTNTGAVYLFSFSDSSFNAGQLEGIIGYGYGKQGGKNIDMTTLGLDPNDKFGYHVSLDGTNLAVAALSDDGFGNTTSNTGAVYLYSFSDTFLNGGQLESIIGKGYAGGKNLDTSVIAINNSFGSAVSLDGNRLAVGATADNGSGGGVLSAGAVYLFSFSDNEFSGGTLDATIGAGYTGGKNVDVTGLEGNDRFGSSVSLEGTQLAAGAYLDDGFGNAAVDSGSVYLFSFSDTNFNGGNLEGIVGKGYTGGKNVDVTNLGAGEMFAAFGVELDGMNLAVGAPLDNGFANAVTEAGAVYLFSFTDSNFNGGVVEAIIGTGYTGGKNIDMTTLDIQDHFGAGISLDGTRLAVGAYLDDGFGNALSDSGAVYLFSFTDSVFSGGTLETTLGAGYTGGKNLHLENLESSDRFGQDVSLDGNNLAVGAYQDDGFNNTITDVGAVYLFSFSDSNFNGGQLEGIIGSGYNNLNKNIDLSVSYYIENSDRFGRAVSLSGNSLAVSADLDDGFNNTTTDVGAVYLFSFADSYFSDGILEAVIGKGYIGGKNIDIAALESSDQFGIDVSLDGTNLAVGVKLDDGSGNSATDTGAVYLFSFTDSSFNGGTQEAIIGSGYTGGKNVDVTSLDNSDWFGRSVSLDGTNIAIGVESDDGFSNAAVDTGAVYLFSFTDSSFNGGTQEAIIGSGYTGAKNINMPGLELNDKFGSGVALDGTKLAIGAEFEDGNANSLGGSGAVYLYSFTDTSFNGGIQEAIIGSGYTGGKNFDLTDLDGGDRFGVQVDLDGQRLVVGAPFAGGSGNAAGLSGDVYLFSFTDNTFTGITKEAVLGLGYTGGKNLDISDLEASDRFGTGVSLDGNRLADTAFPNPPSPCAPTAKLVPSKLTLRPK